MPSHQASKSRKHSPGFLGGGRRKYIFHTPARACKRGTCTVSLLLTPVFLPLGGPSHGAGTPLAWPWFPSHQVAGLPTALTLTAVPTGTVTHTPPASTRLTCLKPQGV